MWSVIGSIRRECLDHVIVFDEASLRHTLRSYFRYYHTGRLHCPRTRIRRIHDPYNISAKSPRFLKSAVCITGTSVARPNCSLLLIHRHHGRVFLMVDIGGVRNEQNFESNERTSRTTEPGQSDQFEMQRFCSRLRISIVTDDIFSKDTATFCAPYRSRFCYFPPGMLPKNFLIPLNGF
jgi:hypothetical protein